MIDTPHETRKILFHRPTALEKLWGIWPESTGFSIAKPSYRMASPGVSGYGLVYISEGAVYFIDSHGTEHLLQKNTMLCLIPGVVHQYYYAKSEQAPQMYWVTFNGKQSLQMLNRIGFSAETPFLSGWDEPSILSRLRGIEKSFVTEEKTDRLSFVLSLIHWFDELLIQARQRGFERAPDTSFLQNSIDIMNTHFTNGIRVQDVAEHIGMTRSHFTRMFTEKMNISPKMYLQQLRMEKAMHYLKETTFSITEIALAISYPDVYSFSRAFSQYYGFPPSQARHLK